MLARSVVCAVFLFLPHLLCFFVPGNVLGFLFCFFWDALLFFPLFCGLCRGRLLASSGREYLRFARCGLVVMAKVFSCGALLLLPFAFALLLFGTLGRLAAALLGGCGVTAWGFVCTRWFFLAQFAHLPCKEAFLASCLFAKRSHTRLFLIQIKLLLLSLFIVGAPFALKQWAQMIQVAGEMLTGKPAPVFVERAHQR